jgi:hypothetical protein
MNFRNFSILRRDNAFDASKATPLEKNRALFRKNFISSLFRRFKIETLISNFSLGSKEAIAAQFTF